jgi:hypothetical protein
MFDFQKRRNAQIVAQGSPNYPIYVGVINAGIIQWFDKDQQIADGQKYDYFDTMLITNNGPNSIELYLDTQNNNIPVLAYNAKSLKGQPFRRWGIKNTGSANTTAGDIILEISRSSGIVQTPASGVVK